MTLQSATTTTTIPCYRNMEEYVDFKRLQFDKLESQVPAMREQVKKWTQEMELLQGRCHILKKQELKQQIDRLNRTIEKIVNQVDRKRFEAKIQPYLVTYRWHMMNAKNQANHNEFKPSTVKKPIVQEKKPRQKRIVQPKPQSTPLQNSHAQSSRILRFFETHQDFAATATVDTTPGQNNMTSTTCTKNNYCSRTTMTSKATSVQDETPTCQSSVVGDKNSTNYTSHNNSKKRARWTVYSSDGRDLNHDDADTWTVTQNRDFNDEKQSCLETQDNDQNLSEPISVLDRNCTPSALNELDNDLNVDHEKEAAILFMECLAEMGDADPVIQLKWSDTCPSCNLLMILSVDGSAFTCPKCHYTFAHVEATTAATGYNEQVEVSSFTYQKTSHLNDWIIKVMDQQPYRVPQSVIEQVMEYWYKECIRKNICDINSIELIFKHITASMISKALQHYGHKLTDYKIQIRYQITGIPPPQITPEQIAIFRTMFKACLKPVSQYMPANKINLGSYGYYLYKFSQILGWTHLLKYFPLLKGEKKLKEYEKMFAAICKDLKWPFIPIDKTTHEIPSRVKRLLEIVTGKT